MPLSCFIVISINTMIVSFLSHEFTVILKCYALHSFTTYNHTHICLLNTPKLLLIFFFYYFHQIWIMAVATRAILWAPGTDVRSGGLGCHWHSSIFQRCSVGLRPEFCAGYYILIYISIFNIFNIHFGVGVDIAHFITSSITLPVFLFTSFICSDAYFSVYLFIFFLFHKKSVFQSVCVFGQDQVYSSILVTFSTWHQYLENTL